MSPTLVKPEDAIKQVTTPPVPALGSLKPEDALNYASSSPQDKSILPTDNKVTDFSPVTESTDGNSKYDAGYIAGNTPIEDYRYQNESAMAQVGAGVVRTVGGAILNLGQAVSLLASGAGAGIADAASAVNNEFTSDPTKKTGYYGLDDITDNAMDGFFYGLEDKMKEQWLPVYKDTQWANKSIWQQMGSTAWWADDGASVAAFALSNIVPAGVIGDVGLGGKVASLATKGLDAVVDAGESVGKMGSLGKYANEVLLSKAGLTNPVGLAKTGDAIAQNAYMTTSEALFMSRDAGNAVQQNYLQSKGKQSVDDLNPQEQAELANQKAVSEKYTFWSNMVALTGSSFVEAGFANKLFGHASPEDLKGLINLGEGITDDASKVVQSPVQNFLNTKAGSVVRNIPKYAFTEGIYKANIQNAIQSVTTQFGFQGKGDYLTQVAQTAVNNLGSAEAWKALMPNLLIGVGMGVIGGVKEQGAQNKAVSEAVSSINSSKENFLNLQNVMYERDAQGNIQTDVNGKPKFNVPAIQDFVANQLQSQDLQSLHNTLKNAGDEQTAKIIKNELFTKYALAHLEAGLGDEFVAKVKALNSYKDEDLAKMGFDPIELDDNGNKVSVQSRVQDLLQKSTQIGKDYDTASKTIGLDDYFKTGNKTADAIQNANLRNARINEAVKTQSRSRALDDLIQDSHRQVLELQANQLKSGGGEDEAVSSVNNLVRSYQAKLQAADEGDQNGNIRPNSRQSTQINNELSDLKDQIIQQKEAVKPILEKLGYEVTPDTKEITDGSPEDPDITSTKEHLKNIEDAKVAKLGLKDRYDAITDYNTGADSFIKSAQSYMQNKVDVKNQQEDAANTQDEQVQSFKAGDFVEYGNTKGYVTPDENGNLTVNGQLLSKGFLDSHPDIRKYSDSELTSYKENQLKEFRKQQIQSRINLVNERLSKLGKTDKDKQEQILNHLIKIEDLVNETKQSGRTSQRQLARQISDIQDTINKLSSERETLGDQADTLKSKIEDLKDDLQNGDINDNYELLDTYNKDLEAVNNSITENNSWITKLTDALKTFQNLWKNFFPNKVLNLEKGRQDYTDAKSEIQLTKDQIKDLKDTNSDLLGIKTSIENRIKFLEEEIKDYELQAAKLEYNPVADKSEVEGDDVPTPNPTSKTFESPMPLLETTLNKTAGTVSNKDLEDDDPEKLVKKHDQLVWNKWTNDFDPSENPEGYHFRTVTIDDSEYGLNGSRNDLYSIEPEQYQTKDNVKVLVLDKNNNPVYQHGVLLSNSLVEAGTRSKPSDYLAFRSDNEQLAKIAIQDHSDFIKSIQESDKPLKLKIEGKGKGVIAHATEPISAEAAFGKQLPLIVVINTLPDGKPIATIGSNDYSPPLGLTYVDYNGNPVGAETRTLTPQESKNIVKILKEYAKLRGDSTAVNNKEFINTLKGILLLNQRKGNQDLSIYFVKGENKLVFGDSVVDTKDLIDGKYDEQLRSFLDNQIHQVDRKLVKDNDTYKDVNGKTWKSYQDYLLSPRDVISETPLTFVIQPKSDDVTKPQFLNTYLTYSRPLNSVEEVKPQVETEKTQSASFNFGTTLPLLGNDVPSWTSLSEMKGSLKEQIEPNPETSKLIEQNEGNPKPATKNISNEQGTISSTSQGDSGIRGQDQEVNTTEVPKELIGKYEGPKNTTLRRGDILTNLEYLGKEMPDASVHSIQRIDDRYRRGGDIGIIEVTLSDGKKTTFDGRYVKGDITRLISENVEDNYLDDYYLHPTSDYSPIDFDKEKEWFKKNISSSIPFEQVKGLVDKMAFGKFSKAGQVLISDAATAGTGYHEAFHVVSQLYLTDKERSELYDKYRKDTNNQQATDRLAEEGLAEEFRDYMLTKQSPYKEFFDKIVNFIKGILGIGNEDREKLFSRISQGYFKDSQVKSPSDLDLYKMSNHLDASTTKDVLDSMTLALVNGLFRNNFTIGDVEKFNNNDLSDVDAARFKDVYANTINSITKVMEKIAPSLPNEDFVLGVSKYLNENKAVVQLDHIAYLKKFGINLQVEPDDSLPQDYERGKDTLGIISAIEFSAKSGMPNVIKLMIGSLPEKYYSTDKDGNQITRTAKNNLGLPKLSNYRRNVAILTNELAGLSNLKDQVAKIRQLSTRIPELSDLFAHLGINGNEITSPNLSPEHLELQAKFRQQFDKAYYTFYTQLYDGNNSHLLDANTDKLQNLIKARWQGDAFTNKNAYSVRNGQFILNSEYFDKTYNKSLKASDKQKSVLSFYKDLGVTFSQPNLVNIDVLADKMKALIGKMRDNEISSIFDDEAESKGFVNSILEQETRSSLDGSDNQHINPEGKTVYNVSLNNYLTRLASEINNYGFPKELSWNEETKSGNPLLRHSYYKDLINEGKQIKIVLLEGARINEPGEAGTSTAKLSTPDAASQQFTSVLSGTSPYMRAADQALEHGIQVGGEPKFADLNEITEYFKGHLADELLSSYMLNVEGVGSEYPEYANSAKDLRVFKDALSKANEARYKELINNKSLSREDAINEIDKFVDEDSVKSSIQDWHDKFIEENKLLLQEMNLVRKSGDVYSILGGFSEQADRLVGKSDALSEAQMKSLVEQFTYRQLQGNIEQTKLLTGDLGFYKDFFKRTKGATGTGKTSWVGSDIDAWLNKNKPRIYRNYEGKIKVDKQSDSKIQSLMFNDVKTVSSNFESYVKALVDSGLDETYAKNLLDKYNQAYDEGDAQGYLTLPEYREFLTRTGDWTPSQEIIFQKLTNEQQVSKEDLTNFISGFPVLKPQYFGGQTDDALFVPTYYKLSAMPLIPSVVKGTELEELMHTMLETGHGLALFKTANKVGAKQGNDLYDENGKINLNADNLITQEINYGNMKVQLDMNPSNKEKVIFGTQFRKLILANLAGKNLTINGKTISGDRLIKFYSDLVNKTVELQTRQLIDDLGITKVGENYKIGNTQPLRDVLSNTALSRQAPDNLLEGIKQVLPQGESHKQFDILVSRNKIENILMSMITNNVIKQKTFGDMRVQGASTGFEAKTGLKGRGIADAEKATWWSKVEHVGQQESGLSFYKADPSGTQPMEVYLPHYFKELIGQNVDVDNIDEKLLKIIGYRTPTQGLNSMELMKIKGFLPQEAGNLIVVPSEIVVKAGSDFDIDKLSLHFPNYEMVDGQPKYLEYNSKDETHQNSLPRIYNRINDITGKILSAPENFQQLITPNSNGQVEEIANEVNKWKAPEKSELDNGKGYNIAWKKNLDIREAYLSGKEGIGIAAIHNTNHVLNQIVKLLAKPDVRLSLEHNETNGQIDFSKEREVGADPVNSPTILDNLSAFLNGLVDMANNPFLSTINTNMDTLPTYLYLLKAGVPLRQAIMFMNQPIVSDFLKAKAVNDSLGLKATDNKLSQESLINKVFDKYPTTYTKLLDLSNEEHNKIYKDNITTTKLENNIKSYKDDNFTNSIQRNILADFLNQQDNASSLGDLINATNADTKGTGSTMNSAQDLIDRFNDLKENSIFENVDKYMDETFLGAFHRAVGEGTKIYKPVFYTEHPLIKNELARIKNQVNLNKFADSEKAMNLAKNDIINFVLQTQPISSIILKNEAKIIFQGMSRDLAKAKEHPLTKNNPLIKELYPLISPNASREIATSKDLDNIKMFSKKLEAVDQNLLTEGWKNLFEIDEKFAQNLMTFTILQSGLNNSPVSFTQYAPNEQYVKLTSRLLSNPDVDFTGFYDKFIRNNYQNNDVVPKIDKYRMTQNGLVTIADGQVARVTTPRRSKITGKLLGRDLTQNDYVKAWSKQLNGYELYKNSGFQENGVSIFNRVSKLGDGYNLKEWTDESIILSNRLDNQEIPDKSTATDTPSFKAKIQNMIDESPTHTEEQKQELTKKLAETKNTSEDIGKILKEICG